MREDPAKGDDEDKVEDDANDDEDHCDDDEDEEEVDNDVARYERRRSHVLREKKRHGEKVDPSLSCNSQFKCKCK